MNAELHRKLSARRDAVPRLKLAGMDKPAKLIAQLHVQGDMALCLQM
jgi:hypothetical protein